MLWGVNREAGNVKTNTKAFKKPISGDPCQVTPEVTQHISFCKKSDVDMTSFHLYNYECFPVRFQHTLVILVIHHRQESSEWATDNGK